MYDLGDLDNNLFKLIQNESGYVGMDYTLEDTYDVTLHILSIINDVLPIVNTLKTYHPIRFMTVNEWHGDVVIISIETERTHVNRTFDSSHARHISKSRPFVHPRDVHV